jgi:hypothetical protein
VQGQALTTGEESKKQLFGEIREIKQENNNKWKK